MEDTYFLAPIPVFPGAAPLAALGLPKRPMFDAFPEMTFVAPIQNLLGPQTTMAPNILDA